MRIGSGGLALLAGAFVAGAVLAPPHATGQPSSDAEVAQEELREFVAIFSDLRENAAGTPGSEPPEERRESVEIIEEHGWTLQDYNRVAALVNSDSALFQEFSRILDEDS